MSSRWETVDQIESDQKRLKNRLEELKESKEVYGEVLNSTDDIIEVWEALRDRAEDGETVFAPSAD
jgi:hypothetical protein